MPMSSFSKRVSRAGVRELVALQSDLKARYQVAREDESKPANRDLIRRWDLVDERITKLSGPDGGGE